MKKWVFSILILVTIIFLRVNYVWPPNYVFKHSLDMIVSVELLYNQNEASPNGYDYFDFHLIRELSVDELESFMNAVYALDTDKGGYPPRWGYGRYIARVTYSNGDIEMLGSYNIEFIAAGEDQTGTGRYYFVGDSFEDVFAQYVEIENYPQK